MRFVVVHIKCDICEREVTGEEIRTVTWNWDKQDLELELDPDCHEKLVTYSVEDLISYSRVVEKKTNRGPRGPYKKKAEKGEKADRGLTGQTPRYKPELYWEMLSNEDSNGVRAIACPLCHSRLPNPKSFFDHYRKQHNERHWTLMYRMLNGVDWTPDSPPGNQPEPQSS